MLQIFGRIAQASCKPRPCIQQSLRLFSYKPVVRKAPATLDAILSRKRRWKNVYTRDCDFNLDMQISKPFDNGRSLKIIESIASDPNEIGVQDFVDVFEKLGAGIISDNALVHENFNVLIEASKLLLPKLTVTQNVQIFSQICQAEIPMFDELSETVAKALLEQIRLMSVDEIIRLDYSIRKYYARERKLSKLFEEMRQAARTSFIVKSNNELVDNQSYDKLIRMMKYLSNNQSLIRNMDTMSLCAQLMLKDDWEFNKNDVVCVIITLARFSQLNEDSKELLKKMFRIWCFNETKTINDVLGILKLLLDKKLYGIDLTPFHNATFVEHCVQHAIEQSDLNSSFTVLDKFNEMNITSTELIDFLSALFNNRKYFNLDGFATVCVACAKAKYVPSNWKRRFVPAIEQIEYQRIDTSKQVDLAFALCELGIYHEGIMENVMESDDIRVSNKKNEDQFNEIVEHFIDDMSDKIKSKGMSTYLRWLTSDLEKFVGKNKILNNVTISDNSIVPIVMKVNTKTGNFVNMKANATNENLTSKQNELIIGVLTQDINATKENFEFSSKILTKQRKEMKKRGWIVITLDESLYGSMETYKRAYTFFKIVLYAINNREK